MFEINEPIMFVFDDVICRQSFPMYLIGRALIFGSTAAAMNISVPWKTARGTRTPAVI